MKKRHLRPCIEHLLCSVTAVLMLPLLMLHSIELKAIPATLLMILVITVNLLILNKYGKGIWLEHDKH